MSKVQRIIAVVFLVVGLAALGIGAYLALVPAIPAEFLGTTQATITDIESYYANTTTSRRSNLRHSVLVSYEVDGQAYERELGYYQTGMQVGQQLDIQYDTRDPNLISSSGGRLVGMIILLVLGVVFAVLGVIFLIKPVTVHVNVNVNRRRIR